MSDRQYFGIFCLMGAIALANYIGNAERGIELMRKLAALSGLNFFVIFLALILLTGLLFGAAIACIVHFHSLGRKQ